MKDQLIQLFNYSNWANSLVLNALTPAYEKELALISHIIASQEIWYNRVKGSQIKPVVFPTFPLEECKNKWSDSLEKWLKLLAEVSEKDLNQEINYQSTEGIKFQSLIKDIAIHVNNHSTHHRAQIVRSLRERGVTPPQTDYIVFTRNKKD